MNLGGAVQVIDLENDDNSTGGISEGDSDVIESEVLLPSFKDRIKQSEVDIQELTIKLLTSPENLDFALQHQADKVMELKAKVCRLLTLNDSLTHSVLPYPVMSPQDISHNVPAQEHYDPVTHHMTNMNISVPVTPPFPPRCKRTRTAGSRAKNRPRPRYIQLPPTFKYPEPIDVRPRVRGYSTPNGEARQQLRSPPQSAADLHPGIRPTPLNNNNNNNNNNNIPPYNTCVITSRSGSDVGPVEAPKLVHTPWFQHTLPAAPPHQGLLPDIEEEIPQTNVNTGNMGMPVRTQETSINNSEPIEHHTLTFRSTGADQRIMANQLSTKEIYQQNQNNLSLSQPLCLSLSPSADMSHPGAVSSSGKPMFEIVVGDMREFDSKVLDQVLWENGPGFNQSCLSEDIEIKRQKRVCPKHHATHGFDNRMLCACPGPPRMTSPWSGGGGTGPAPAVGPAPRHPTPFMYWKNAVELSKARRCRTKIEPDMLDLLETKYNESHFVSPYERKTLADKLGITERAVIYWFQNRRRKDIKNLNNMEQQVPE